MSAKKSRTASFAKALERQMGQQTPSQKLDPDGDGDHSLAAWFLGPKGENASLFQELVTCAIDSHARDRSSIYKTDPPWITEEIKKSPAYRQTTSNLKTHYDQLLRDVMSRFQRRSRTACFSLFYWGEMRSGWLPTA